MTILCFNYSVNYKKKKTYSMKLSTLSSLYVKHSYEQFLSPGVQMLFGLKKIQYGRMRKLIMSTTLLQESERKILNNIKINLLFLEIFVTSFIKGDHCKEKWMFCVTKQLPSTLITHVVLGQNRLNKWQYKQFIFLLFNVTDITFQYIYSRFYPVN